MSDPFASVQVPGANGSPTGTATAPRPPQDPFQSAHDMEDPFAVGSDFRGGDFIPSPGIELLAGRLIVMIPRKLDPEAADPNNPGKTREVYTVDLTVLDGGHLEYTYRQKGDPEKGTQDEWKQWVVGTVSPDSPFTIPGYWVPQAGLIGKLKQAHRNGRPFLGVPSMIPTKDQRDKGITAAQVRQEYVGWVARNKIGSRPRYSWGLEDPTPEQKAAAMRWWARVKDQIQPIIPVS